MINGGKAQDSLAQFSKILSQFNILSIFDNDFNKSQESISQSKLQIKDANAQNKIIRKSDQVLNSRLGNKDWIVNGKHNLKKPPKNKASNSSLDFNVELDTGSFIQNSLKK